MWNIDFKFGYTFQSQGSKTSLFMSHLKKVKVDCKYCGKDINNLNESNKSQAQ